MAEMNAERAMTIQVEAAKKLLDHIREQGAGDDHDLISDAIEGETGLVEAIDRALAEIDECDVMIIGLKEKEKAFEARRKQTEGRQDRLRAAIEQAMLSTDQIALRLPTATLTLVKRKPSIVISNEADIPVRFWAEQERPAPKLDKSALSAALAAKEVIPGASLDNGAYTLTIRRK